MFARRLRGTLLLFAVFSNGCVGAGSGSAVSRSFARPEVEQIPLKTLHVYVVVRPAVEVEGKLKVDAFPPPRPGDRIASESRNVLAEDSMYSALERWGEQTGYRIVRVRLPVARPTLQTVLDAAGDDAVLVVRAVPVDRFAFFEQSGEQKTIDQGSERQEFLVTTADEKVERYGRLYVGQAFAFDPPTGLRLWSEQVPDFPREGRLTADAPFLRYGFVAESFAEVEDPVGKAQRAANAFIPAILERFPAPNDGSAEALSALRSEDVMRAAKVDAFLDRNHFAIELGVGWQFATVSSDVLAVQNAADPNLRTEVELPSLGTGELAPAGVIEVPRLRLLWVVPGGLTFGVTATFGVIPNDFSRTALVASTEPEFTDDNQRVEVSSRGGIAGSGTLSVGRFVFLSPQWILHPEGGLFFDFWSLDVSSSVQEADHPRLGLEGTVSVLYRFSTEGPWYVRAGAGGRFGYDFAGAVTGGLVLNGGLGLLF